MLSPTKAIKLDNIVKKKNHFKLQELTKANKLKSIMYSCYLPCCKVSFLSNIIVVIQTFFRSVFFIFFTFNLLVSSYVRQISYRNIIYYLHVMQLLMWLGLHTLCCYLFSICPTYSLLFSPISPALKKCFFFVFYFLHY